MTIEQLQLTPASLQLMQDMVNDAGNWSGCVPLFNHITKESRGNLTQLKRKKLVTTFRSDGEEWAMFTPLAKELWPILTR